METSELPSISDPKQEAQSRKERVRTLLGNHSPADTATRSVAQETYVRKLRSDIQRTEIFLLQAQKANSKLSETIKSTENSAPSKWDDRTRQNARIVALFEAYRTLPYTAMKNDLIGIATAASLTEKAVVEQRNASEHISSENSTREVQIAQEKQIQNDYIEIDALLRQQINSHPEKMEQLQAKLRDSQPVEIELQRQLQSVQIAAKAAKKVEDRMFHHMRRVVTKLHALQDWENASVMDEATFASSVGQSVSFLAALVSNLLVPDKWVAVGGEEMLVLVMMRNNLLKVRGHEVRLREYGFD